MTGAPARTLLLWCPDWPVLAAEIVDGVPAHRPGRRAARQPGGRLLPSGPAPRGCVEGCASGRRRGAARSSPSWSTTPAGTRGRSSRWSPRWRSSSPGVEVVRPGACAVAARGPARYFGGEEAAAERIVEHVAQSLRGGEPGRHRRRGLRGRAGRPRRADRGAGRDTGVPGRDGHRGARPVRRWPTCCAGWACAPSATSPRCRPATCWPGSGSTRRWPTGWPPGGTSAHSPSGSRRPT